MRAIICGGRDYANRSQATLWLSRLHSMLDIVHVIEGGATGADRIARDWALATIIPVTTVPADWDRFDNAAGPLRNSRMLQEFKPDVLLALPGKTGTLNMINQARAARLPVYLFPNLEPTL